MFPIPEFDKSNPDHLKLVELSRECHTSVSQHKFARPGRFKSMRNEALRLLSTKIQEIDAIVRRIVKT